MKYRKSMTANNSKQLFSKTGSKTHRKNLLDTVMRGGIRL
jgi:hypothetical protein